MSQSEILEIRDADAAGIPPIEQTFRAPGSPSTGLARLKRAVFEFFNSGAGGKVSAAVIDVHFLLWKLRHPGAKFAGYYAGSIAGGLKRGGTHKTLGAKKFLSGSLVSRPSALDPAENRARGENYFRLALAHGLRPEHRCVDFGCGSLRVGQHLIGHQDAGNYWGLDMVSDFYEAGATLLPAGLIAAKTPRFDVIGPVSLAAARKVQPDFIFSFAVLKHVPPAELNAYFRDIAAMMAPRTQAVITFNEAERSSRTGAKIWDYCKDEIAASVRSQDAGLECSIRPLKSGPGNNALPRTSVLLIRRGREGASPLSASHRRAEIPPCRP